MTGMRRNEVLGLKWTDIDTKEKRLALNRGLVAVGYELHQTRGKTRKARRSIDLDETTISVLEGWSAFQAEAFAAIGITNDEGWAFTAGHGKPNHPHAHTNGHGTGRNKACQTVQHPGGVRTPKKKNKRKL